MNGVLSWAKSNALWLLLALAAFLAFDWLMLNKKRLRIRWYTSLPIAILHVAIGLCCVKLFALAEAGFDAEKAGSMSLFGAVFLLPVFYFTGAKLSKRQVSDVFDVFTVAMVLTLMLARINCLISGCCLGRLIGETGSRWPTREIELLFYLVFLIVIAPRVYGGRTRGRAYPIFMVAYGAFRAVIECFRVSNTTEGILHISHIWALTSLILGVLILTVMRRQAPQNNKRQIKSKTGGKQK